MTRDDIIRMAREAGFEFKDRAEPKLERFAALVAAAEREACAKVADDMTLPDWVNEQIATAIRARGQE